MSRLTILLLALLLAAPATQAAKTAPARSSPADREEVRGDSLVTRVQKALGEAGLYLGPATGVMDKATEEAIRAFQKRSGMKGEPKVTEQLALQIESSHKIQALLGRLEEVRGKAIEAARSALMSREETRRLLESPPDETADPARDPKPCFRSPTPACLLEEAAETAKTIPADDLRDWARGELLVAQAKAGLIPQAMDTARRVHDPRLILVALRDIAEGQAEAGLTGEAAAAAEAIPDASKRIEALAAIAEIEAKRGLSEGARASAQRLLALLPEVEDTIKRVALRTRAAVVLRRAGDAAGGDAALKDAEAEARREKDGAARGAALRHIAQALAELRRVGPATALLDDIPADVDRTPVLMALTVHHAKAGEFDRARALAQRIPEARYRTVALAQVAAELGAAGHVEETLDLLEKAKELSKDITLPFARDYAAGQMVAAWSRLGGRRFADARDTHTFDRTLDAVARIADDRLRAHMLWTVAADRRRAGDAAGAKATEDKARDGTIEVRSALTRVWLHGDIALERSTDGEKEAAIAAFRRGLEEAEPLDNAWSRTRALAKLAATLNDLQRAGISVGR
ncbi:MAG: peptidoglycan-binding protein [Magnetospirillum sp. WYHS-4]